MEAIIRHGVELPMILAAARVVYGRRFNPLITLKALSYFEDLPSLPHPVQLTLASAAAKVDISNLPTLPPYVQSA